MSPLELDRRLRELQTEVLLMGSMVEKAIQRSVDALRNRDLVLARRIVEQDVEINRLRFDIEEKCIALIATQEPVARDLRGIVAVLNIIVDLERMGDHAEGIARICIMIGDQPPIKPLVDIPRMAEKAQLMLHRSLDALVERDAELAVQICQDDDEVDALYDQVYKELLVYMINDPKAIDRATHLLWVAHNLERIADRSTNIAERVVFLVTGHMQELASKY